MINLKTSTPWHDLLPLTGISLLNGPALRHLPRDLT